MDQDIFWAPQDVADVAMQLSQTGNEFRTIIAEIYGSFNRLGAEGNWIGENYNVIADDVYNSSIPKFEEWANYLQNSVPQVMYNIAEMQAQGGVVTFSLTPNSTEIQSVQRTVYGGEGVTKIDIDIVRNATNNDLASNSQNAYAVLQKYYSKFEELSSLRNNQAILNIYTELDAILTQCRSVLEMFQTTAQETIEKTVQGIELTNEETRQIAEQLRTILAV